MRNNPSILFIEINKDDFIFIYGKSDENFNFELIQEVKVPLNGIEKNKIKDSQLVRKIIKENISYIEKQINFSFKDIILIINNFNCNVINFSGYKKLNGAQLEKDNITYILNSLKSKISEIEEQKTILHIFNSKYFLDKKKNRKSSSRSFWKFLFARTFFFFN